MFEVLRTWFLRWWRFHFYFLVLCWNGLTAADEDDHDCLDGPSEHDVGSSPRDAMKRAAALFVLKVAEKHRLPLSGIDNFLMDVQHSSLKLLMSRNTTRHDMFLSKVWGQTTSELNTSNNT